MHFKVWGTTFIKLGQFLATRPDIIGEDIAKELEKLQDKLPPFQLEEAKNILRKEIEKENFDKIKKFFRFNSGCIYRASALCYN